ncbi:hypothetical protein [Herbaspirillum seropedicae]|uniref:hypothetical protein n=1 Tax=Herbaspirillum seropedicae TaxID=964 RepID=UPI0028555369|nr:hypothetical protein [Herbaspirillum seropedicae]MDR6396109.1 hypothetical protein [Herbaspirillum seropedicae]
MTAEISRDGAVVANTKLQNYWENAQAKAPTLFLPIRLDPGETWSCGAIFFSIFDRRTEKEYRELERALKADVMQKLEDGAGPRLVAGDDALVSPLTAMFRRLFIWEPGEYQVKLSVTTDQKAVALEQTYRFALFESDSQEFYAQVERFKFGEGIWYTPDISQRDLSINVPWTK